MSRSGLPPWDLDVSDLSSSMAASVCEHPPPPPSSSFSTKPRCSTLLPLSPHNKKIKRLCYLCSRKEGAQCILRAMSMEASPSPRSARRTMGDLDAQDGRVPVGTSACTISIYFLAFRIIWVLSFSGFFLFSPPRSTMIAGFRYRHGVVGHRYQRRSPVRLRPGAASRSMDRTSCYRFYGCNYGCQRCTFVHWVMFVVTTSLLIAYVIFVVTTSLLGLCVNTISLSLSLCTSILIFFAHLCSTTTLLEQLSKFVSCTHPKFKPSPPTKIDLQGTLGSWDRHG